MAVLVAAALLAACTGGSECEAGPAVVTEIGPSLVLDSVTGVDGAPVRTVVLSRIRFDGSPVDPRVLASATRSEGLALDGGRLVCDLPCGLAGAAGRWQLRVTGPEAGSAQVDALGAPRLDPGGCSEPVGEAPEIAIRFVP